MFDDGRRWLKSIDKMVDEKQEELDKIYERFDGNCRGTCPLCRALEKSKYQLYNIDVVKNGVKTTSKL